MNIFLVLAFVSAIIAFLVNEFAGKGDDFLFSVAGWLILTLVFYLASLLFGGVTVGRKSQ